MKKHFFKIFESNIFIFIIALIFIAFGFYYWKNFSRNVDKVANEFLHKQTLQTIELNTNIRTIEFINFISSKYNENIYEFKDFSEYYQSREFSEGDSIKYFFYIAKNDKNNIILSIKYTHLPKNFDTKQHSQNCLHSLQKFIHH